MSSNRYSWLRITGFTGFLVLTSIRVAVADFQVGAASQVVNDVTGTPASTKQRSSLRAGINVFQNETIDTSLNSASRIVFKDRTELSIGPTAEVVLDHFVFDPNLSTASMVLSITKGVVRFSTGILPKPSYSIRTPAGWIAVRGTVLTVLIVRGGEAISVESGTALVTCHGVTVAVSAGQTTYTSFTAAPTQPRAGSPLPPVTQMDALLR
jgi:hypothetical protein